MSGRSVALLRGSVLNYEWGKIGRCSCVANFALNGGHIGEIDDNLPYAELWMGALRPGVAQIERNGTWQDMQEWLDSEEGRSFRGYDAEGLPFLLKVLSVAKSLSIQVHPDKERAHLLHSEKPELYKDANHKPEMAICISREFTALCGFRPVHEILGFIYEFSELFNILGEKLCNTLPKLSNYEGDFLKTVYSRLFLADPSLINRELVSLCQKTVASEPHRMVCKLHEQFPGDVGVLAPFFMNIVNLKEGECLFMRANTLHAYIQGEVIECMAASDNVIRAGLTPKFKDVETLLSCVDFSSLPIKEALVIPNMSRPSNGSRIWGFLPPVKEFQVQWVTSCEPLKVSLELDTLAICFVHWGGGEVNGMNVEMGYSFVLKAKQELDITKLNASEISIFIAAPRQNS